MQKSSKVIQCRAHKMGCILCDGDLWDSFVLTRDDLASWEDFKCAVCKVYPQHEVASRPASLAASLPPLLMPSAPLPSRLLTVPAMPSLLLPPALALTLSLAALEVLLPPRHAYDACHPCYVIATHPRRPASQLPT